MYKNISYTQSPTSMCCQNSLLFNCNKEQVEKLLSNVQKKRKCICREKQLIPAVFSAEISLQ